MQKIFNPKLLDILIKSPFNLSKEKAEETIDKIYNMSLEEKVGQLFFLLHCDSYNLDEVFFLLKKYKPGGLMFRPTTKEVIQQIIKYSQSEMNTLPFFSANIENGANALLANESSYGSAMLLSATNNPELVKKSVEDMAATVSSLGINMTFSPVVDLQLNPENPITGTRSFGFQAEQVIKMSQKFIDGFESSNILPVIKHFPGDGVDNRDHHLLPSVNSLSFIDWKESYGKIYQTLIDQGAPCIMAGHILLPDYECKKSPGILDSEIKPATLSKNILKHLLRKDMNFNGLIITDASNMGGFNSFYPRKQSVVETIKSGCDMLLFTASLDEDYKAIYQAVICGEISSERINEALCRILGTKKLLEKKMVQLSDRALETTMDLKAQVADQGITMIKNLINFKKLDLKKHKKILLIDLHNGKSVSNNIKGYLEKEGFQVTKPEKDDNDFAFEVMIGSRENLREKYDLILYTLNFQGKSNQVTNRISFGMPFGQFLPVFVKEIPTIMISFGNPYHLEDAPRVPVYINSYSDEKHVVLATMDKLLGKSKFKGISPIDAFCGRFDTKC